MKFIPVRVRVATVVHGHEDVHHEVTESCKGADWQDKLLAIDRLLSATERRLLIAGSHGRVTSWEYEGGLLALTKRLADAGLALSEPEAT
jgi:hypothetical protein